MTTLTASRPGWREQTAWLAWRIRRREAQAPVLTDAEPALPAAPAQARIGDVLDTEEISIEIGPGLIVSALDQGRGLGQRITNLRLHIARAYGLILPDVRITDGTGFADGEYVIRLQGVVRGRGQLLPRGVLATVVIPMEVLSTHLMEVVKSNLPALLTLSAMQRMIRELCNLSDEHRAQMNQRFFDGMVPDKVSPDLLLAVLRGMLEERLSVRNLVLITDAVHEARNAPTPEACYELVRRRLRAQITEQFLAADGHLDLIQLHPQWEAEITRAETEAGRGGTAPVPQLQQRLVEALRKVLAGLPPATEPVLGVPDHRRRLVRLMLGSAGVALPVLGLDEIDPAARIRLCGTVSP